MDELYPRLKSLTLLARQYDIGINIDAEEADRLEISSTCWRSCALNQSWPAGTGSASSFRPIRNAARSSLIP
jgi:proline dehydrogenase